MRACIEELGLVQPSDIYIPDRSERRGRICNTLFAKSMLKVEESKEQLFLASALGICYSTAGKCMCNAVQ
jgi:hypothetical protein